jgi:hypothetical protein
MTISKLHNFSPFRMICISIIIAVLDRNGKTIFIFLQFHFFVSFLGELPVS